MDTYSYDIFDTCLSRICGKQDFIFEQLAFEILGTNSSRSLIQDFAQVRRNGENKARTAIINSDIEDVTIEDIYERCDFSPYCQCSKQKIIEKELQIHKRFLVPIFSTLEEIKKLHNQGCQVIYISDMYLSGKFLTEILQERGFFKEGDSLFVSCDSGLTKSSGHLYDYIKENLNINYKKWIHKGDNYYSDYIIPKKKGIKAIISHSEFSYYEKKTIECEFSGAELDIYKFASIERAVRLSLPNTPENRFASNFVAPIYVPFVYHILYDAQIHHRTLFFVARDGFILFLIAQQLSYLFPNVKFHYLYASRKSLYLPGIKELSEEGLMEAIPHKGDVNVDDILSILHLKHLEIERKDYDTLSPKNIIKELFKNQTFVKELSKVYNSQNELCIQYFREQGLTNPGSAIVDVFGTRKCQKFINNIMKRHGYPDVYGYYYEVLSERISDSSTFYALNYQEQLKIGIHDTYISQKQQLFEQYFSITPHERTGGYQKANEGNIEPIFDKDIVDKKYKKKVFSSNKYACILFATYLSELNLHNHENCSRVAQAVFNHFFHVPRKEYLAALEGFYESDDNYSKKTLNKRSLYTIFFGRDRYLTWMAGDAIYNSGIFYRIVRWILSYKWQKDYRRKFSLT